MASARLCVRVTAEDLAKLKHAAREDNLPLSTMVRFAIADWLELSEERQATDVTSFRTRACLTVEVRRT